MSIHPEILELIHAAIDGIATETEQLRLRDAIARDAAVRDEYRRLQGLSDLLARVEPEEPPARLAASVMRAVRSRRPGVRAYWPGGRVALRYAYAVAAGAVLGILGLHLASGGSIFGPEVPGRDAGATIGTPSGAGRLDLTPVGIEGFATVRPSPQGTAIGLQLKAEDPVELVFRFDPTQNGGRVDVFVIRGGEATEAGSLELPRKN